MAEERTGRIWDEVRRALGRLVGRVTTHAISAERTVVQVAVRDSHAARLPPVMPGVRGDWLLTAGVASLPPPAAHSGGDGVDLATVATVISADGSLGTADAEVLTLPVRIEGGAVRDGAIEKERLAARVQHEVVQFGPTAAHSASTRFVTPTVTALSVARAALPSKRPRHEEAALWPFRAPRVRAGLAELARVPLVRERLAQPEDVSPALAFGDARQALASGAGVPESDVLLIGVFPRVPLSAVQKLSLGQDGASLQVWLKPELIGPGRKDSVRWATVVLGRQRSTGKTLQAVLKIGL